MDVSKLNRPAKIDQIVCTRTGCCIFFSYPFWVIVINKTKQLNWTSRILKQNWLNQQNSVGTPMEYLDELQSNSRRNSRRRSEGIPGRTSKEYSVELWSFRGTQKECIKEFLDGRECGRIPGRSSEYFLEEVWRNSWRNPWRITRGTLEKLLEKLQGNF